LSQLREIALEQVAHILDRRRQERGAEASPNASERVMVCVSSRSPNALRLLRKGARLADRLDAPWYAVYVQTPDERTEKIDAATQRRLADSLELAQQLHGIPMTFKGPDFPAAVARFAREYGITHVVVGRSHQAWYRNWLGLSLFDRLLRCLPGVDLISVDTAVIWKADGDSFFFARPPLHRRHRNAGSVQSRARVAASQPAITAVHF
jgi:two-component system sensor histidine kinase KdpD